MPPPPPLLASLAIPSVIRKLRLQQVWGRVQGSGGFSWGKQSWGGPHGEMEWPQVPGPTDPQKVPTLGLGWNGALWGVSDAQSPGSLQPPHPSLFPLAPGRCCWDLSGLCEWRLRVAGELRVLAGVTGRQKPRGQAQTLGASLELPRSLSLPDVATSPLPAPPGPVGPGPRCLGVSPTSLPPTPHQPPCGF